MTDENYDCEWNDDDEGMFETECGNAFVFNDGGPADNGFRFCPYCGKPIAGSAELVED
jgi:hypothetical protein